jgi:hypothetical protein
MNTAIRRTLTGEFRIEPLDAGRWRLAAGEPYATVLLTGALPDRPLGPACRAVSLDWDGAGVLVTLAFETAAQTFRAAGASILEPQAALYAALPLGRFDRRARDFWGRIFLVARLPGAAALLRALGRRRQRRGKS